MKCHEDEKAESIRLHCFLPVLASFLNLEVVRKKRAVFVQTGERKNSRQVISKPKSNRDANRHTEKSSGCRGRVEVEVKLAMMGSDGDDDVFSLVEFRGRSWHRISTTSTE